MTKEELKKYYYINLEIKQIEKKIEEINSTFMRASLINCERFEKHLTNPQERRMMLIEKYEEKLESAKERALAEAIKIENYIQTIEEPENRMIFRYRYIELKSWSDISKLVHLSQSAVFERHQKELAK